MDIHDSKDGVAHGFNRPLTSQRKRRLCARADQLVTEQPALYLGHYFHAEDDRYMRFLIPEGARVLELGCGVGDQLNSLRPSHGMGVDFSPATIAEARRKYPHLDFRVGDIECPDTLSEISGPFDYIVISDTIGALDDCQALFDRLHRLCERRTRLVIAYYSHFWDPLLKLAEIIGVKRSQEPQNRLSTDDIDGLLHLANFEVIKRDWRQLVPLRLLGLGPIINRYIATLPLIRTACLRNYIVARSINLQREGIRSASVIIPARNERGNIEPAIQRMPRFCEDMEIIFVEGHSKDGTWEEILRVKEKYPDHDIQVMRQDGIGKGNAVFKAFDHARGDVLMILDADLTVPPEQLPKFWNVMASGQAEYVHGSRLVYPMEAEAMRFLNFLANHVFSMLFTWLVNQRLTDTLCGTKVIRREDYRQLKANQAYFGDFDPFGDFDLIFGASKMNLKVLEVPIRYVSRTYGQTQISRFRHGWLLLKMVVFAYRKLKAL